MDASVWVAKTGLTAQQRRMTVIANNLATSIRSRSSEIGQCLRICFIRISGSQARLLMRKLLLRRAS